MERRSGDDEEKLVATYGLTILTGFLVFRIYDQLKAASPTYTYKSVYTARHQAMTVGRDVSALFTVVIKSMDTSDLELKLKKLVYRKGDSRRL